MFRPGTEPDSFIDCWFHYSRTIKYVFAKISHNNTHFGVELNFYKHFVHGIHVTLNFIMGVNSDAKIISIIVS